MKSSVCVLKSIPIRAPAIHVHAVRTLQRETHIWSEVGLTLPCVLSPGGTLGLFGRGREGERKGEREGERKGGREGGREKGGRREKLQLIYCGQLKVPVIPESLNQNVSLVAHLHPSDGLAIVLVALGNQPLPMLGHCQEVGLFGGDHLEPALRTSVCVCVRVICLQSPSHTITDVLLLSVYLVPLLFDGAY